MIKLGKIKILIRYLAGLPKSIYVNFRLLPFNQAIFLPIIVSRHTLLSSLSGKVSLDKLKTGIIRIGFGNVVLLDYTHQRTILHITGNVHFCGKCKIGMGSRILVQGDLHIGENVLLSGNGKIICNKKIEIGNNTSIAWESLLMDTDEHQIYDQSSTIINPDKPITIGDNVWIAARSLVLKGSHIPHGCIIGANSLITKKFETQQAIIAGNPAKVIKHNITWKR